MISNKAWINFTYQFKNGIELESLKISKQKSDTYIKN